MLKKILGFLKSIKQKVEAKKEVQRKILSLYDKNSFVQNFFNENRIKFNSESIETILVFDYDLNRINNIKKEILDGKAIENRGSYSVTHNRDHVHVLSVKGENDKLVYLMVLYPYEPMSIPKALWYSDESNIN